MEALSQAVAGLASELDEAGLLRFTIERSREKGGGLNLKVFGVGPEGSGKGTSGRGRRTSPCM